jgi:hypothetical protein
MIKFMLRRPIAVSVFFWLNSVLIFVRWGKWRRRKHGWSAPHFQARKVRGASEASRSNVAKRQALENAYNATRQSNALRLMLRTQPRSV